MKKTLDHDALALEIIKAYDKHALTAEVVVYRYNDTQLVRDTVTIDFRDDFDYHTTVSSKSIYSET